MISGTGEGLVFLLGLPRSGTTLLSVLLDQHPEISCPPEPWIALALDAIGLVPMGHPADARVIGRATHEFFQKDDKHDPRIESIRSFASTAYSSRLDGASILVDKTPRYWYILDQLETWFPNARYIYLRRDPLDIAASYQKTWGIDLAHEIQSASPNIQSLDLTVGLRRLEDFTKQHEDRVYTLSYESLVTDPKQVMKKVFGWLQIPKLKGLVDGEGHIPQDGLKRVTASTLGDKNILKIDSINPESIGSGLRTLDDDQLRIIYDTLGKKCLVDMGYAKTAEELLNKGLKAPTKSKINAIRKSSEEMVASRWSRCKSWSDLGVELPPEIAGLVHNAQQQVQMATAARDRAESEYAKVSKYLELLKAESQQGVTDRMKLEQDIATLGSARNDAIAKYRELQETHEHTLSKLSSIELIRDELLDDYSKLEREKVEVQLALEDAKSNAREQEKSLNGRIQYLTKEANRLVENSERLLGEVKERSEIDLNETRKLHEDEILKLNQDMNEISESAQARERELQAEIERVTNAYNHIREQQSKWLFGLKPLKSWVRARCKRIAQICVWRAGPRPDPEWPVVTVVTPCFNSESTIRETIESVIGQGYPNLQYIIVDGGSTDGTLDIIEEYRNQIALVISEPDHGMYDAIKKGFTHTDGDVMGYLNADDVFEPGGLWRVAKTFRDRPKTMVAYFEDTINTRGWRTPNAYQPKGIHFYDLLYGNHILFQDGVWWRPEAYRRVHGIDPQMRYAGDYDLWLRMSMHYSFYRAPGHVSCFRKQAGQLSEDMDRYWEEVEQSKLRLRSSIRFWHVWRRFPRWIRSKLVGLFDREPRMFYPHNPGFGLPACEVRLTDPHSPRCRLTQSPPDRFLFSTLDTRFGHTLLNRVWRCEDSDTVMIEPDLCQDELDGLYERYYSKYHGEAYPPVTSAEQLYAGYRGPRLLPRLAERYVLPERIYRRVLEKQLIPWDETSFRELMMMLSGQVDVEDESVRFLDIGCFNGDLLDRLATNTRWQTCGSETNQVAAQTSREKGHEVYVGAAEDLWSKIPVGTEFDVVYLGQVIEHINDPYAFVRRVKTLIKPGGILVMTTPNLDSMQVDLYGPTWSHWHPPYHRVMFGRRGLKLLGERSGFKLTKMRSSSNPGWTVLSQKLNTFGVTGAVPHDYQYTPEEYHRACSLTAWSRLLWDWRNRGDYLLTAFRAER